MLAILSRDDPFQADSFAAKHGITMPILNDRSNAVGPRYGITGIPETFIIGKEGILLDKFIGPDEWDSPANTEMMMKYINQ